MEIKKLPVCILTRAEKHLRTCPICIKSDEYNFTGEFMYMWYTDRGNDLDRFLASGVEPFWSYPDQISCFRMALSTWVIKSDSVPVDAYDVELDWPHFFREMHFWVWFRPLIFLVLFQATFNQQTGNSKHSPPYCFKFVHVTSNLIQSS